ncbi:MAG: hypothetical protein II401_10930 [Bacteroidales bacterium]|nr:hypothetical protein [Bacteroidales bacterium]
METALKLKKIADGVYQVCDTGTEYTRSDVCQKTYNWLLSENRKLRERNSKKGEKIKELQREIKEMEKQIEW